MLDLMLIGDLMGARLDVIVDLKVSDTDHDCLRFKAQQREMNARYVPVHPYLRAVVERRCAGKARTDDLFPEWSPVRKTSSMRERSFKTSNHFTLYRRAVGVEQKLDGRRSSLVNFHLLRRWFIFRMEQAGVAESMIAAVVGHNCGSITLNVYSEGPKMHAARRAVAKIKLPPLDGSPTVEEMRLKARDREEGLEVRAPAPEPAGHAAKPKERRPARRIR